MHGGLNCAHLGCRWDYAQPLNRDSRQQTSLEILLTNSEGNSHT